jgi:phenylacetate-coenzyme A ligase PaaK-like adenylate-forming protein
MGEVITQVQALDPTTVVGFASVIARLARAQLAGRLAIEPEVVLSIGEPMAPEDAVAIDRAWGCPVHDGYGCSELGWLAMSTGEGGPMVHFDDQFILEPLGPDGEVRGHGEESTSVCLTTIGRTAFPLIRYQLADRVRTLPPDPHSNCAFARIESVLGRDDDWFRYGAIEVHPATFRGALLHARHIDEYQVVQTPDGARVLAVLAAPDPDLGGLEDALRAALERAGLRKPWVSVEHVAQLERPSGQKLRRFVPIPG